MLYLEVHSKNRMCNDHKLQQGKFSSILGENTSTGGVELGPGDRMEISFLG